MPYDQDDEDAFDENGVLKDGHSYRVPMRMLDNLQRAVHDHATGLRQARILDAPLHQPGFVRNPRNVAARRALYDALDAELQEAWRTPPSNGTRAPTEQPLQQKRIVNDERLAAYQEYDEWVQSRFRQVTP